MRLRSPATSIHISDAPPPRPLQGPSFVPRASVSFAKAPKEVYLKKGSLKENVYWCLGSGFEMCLMSERFVAQVQRGPESP